MNSCLCSGDTLCQGNCKHIFVLQPESVFQGVDFGVYFWETQIEKMSRIDCAQEGLSTVSSKCSVLLSSHPVKQDKKLAVVWVVSTKTHVEKAGAIGMCCRPSSGWL